MKARLLLWAGLLLMKSTGHAAPTPVDSLKLAQAHMSVQIDTIFAKLQRVSKTNDSLHRELYYYRAKDDFYANAVSSQGSHFDAMIGWGLAIQLAIIGFGGYKYFEIQLNKTQTILDNSINETKEEISKYREKFSYVEYDLYFQTGYSIAISMILAGRMVLPSGVKVNNINQVLGFVESTYYFIKAYLVALNNRQQVEALRNSIESIKSLHIRIDNLYDSDGNMLFEVEKLKEGFEKMEFYLKFCEEHISVINNQELRIKIIAVLTSLVNLREKVEKI